MLENEVIGSYVLGVYQTYVFIGRQFTVDSVSSNTKWIHVWTVIADYHIGSPREQALLLLLRSAAVGGDYRSAPGGRFETLKYG